LFLKNTNFSFNKYKYVFLIILINILASIISEKSWDYLGQENNNYSHVKKRIENFIVPSLNTQDGGYHLDQSMIAVGSGGLFGKGLGEGTQVKHKYLPEADTDFIISSIAEAFGFLSIFLIISVYLFLMYWLLNYAKKTRSNYFSLIIIGYLSILLFHILITLGMAVSLAPITGLPAPFLSYGGSFTLTCFIMLGICNNISHSE